MSGEVHLLGSLQKLTSIDISDNKFSGSILQLLEDSEGLKVLDFNVKQQQHVHDNMHMAITWQS